MKEYDLFIPLAKGSARQQRQLSLPKKRLSKFFGRLTYFPHSNEGLWQLGNVMFRDEVVILRVISSDSASAERYLKHVKQTVKRQWKQKEVLVVSRTIETI